MALRLLIAFFLLAVPLELPGCGPFIPEALFTLKLQPERPEAEFARGELGVLRRTYKRFYLVIAYRYLTGPGLNDAERAALFPPQQQPQPAHVQPGAPWLEARNSVPGVSPLQSIDTYRRGFDPNNYMFFQNCNDDAFLTAAATLRERMRQYGQDARSLLVDWVAAQDTVFTNCRSETPVLPPPASDPRLAADRAYQIAAAKFYAGQYDAAHADFAQIAADARSPWQEIAPYLEARCSIRKGDLPRAADELRTVMADPARPAWHEPAQELLEYVQTQIDPGARIRELAQTLVKPGIQDDIDEDLDDYRLLLDKVDKPPREDDLTDWIKSYQTGDRDHIFEMWQKQKSLPWLVAALEQTQPGDSRAPELIKAAADVKPDSPGYVDAQWNVVRLLPDDQARARTDEILKLDMPVSARNQFRARRMQLARNFQEFLEYAPRTVAGENVDVEEPDPKDEQLLDADSQQILDRIPVTLLKQAAQSQLLSAKVREQLERVVWTRSVLLQSAPSFDDIYELLKSPGLHFRVDDGFGRYTDDTATIDPFRSNWWWPVRSAVNAQQPLSPSMPSFLSPADVEQGKREWDRLNATPTAPNWLSAQALLWAGKMPNDPRIPEALHLAVRATRYGVRDKDTGNLSKRAFDLLHRRYPDSSWAAQTKYWFK